MHGVEQHSGVLDRLGESIASGAARTKAERLAGLTRNAGGTAR